MRFSGFPGVLVVMATAAAIAQAAPTTGHESGRPWTKALRDQDAINPIKDLMLIYDGGEGRLPWTPERFKPYVYRERDGQIDWLFDGFLFIEYIAKSGARLCPITRRKDADKRDWQDLMDHYFQEEQSIAALDQLLNSLAANGRTPLRKRKVVITLPTPSTGSDPKRIAITSQWGELDGRKIDFHKAADRLKAAQWYVNEVLERWREKNYRHLELAGFYWLFERAWQVHHTQADHTQAIGQYIHSKGSHLYWIASWPQGRKDWRQYGFDFVYQQPNYFFHRKLTPSIRLEEACQFAESCGTSMEMEFDDSLLKKPLFLEYFDGYLREYAKCGVWKQKPVAYYEGGGTWGDMSRSLDPAVRSRYEALGNIVAERQKQANHGFLFRQETK